VPGAVIAISGHPTEMARPAIYSHAHECEYLRVASSMMLDQRIGFFDFEGRKVAYSLVGEGPVLVFPPWWISHIELEWQQPGFRSFFSELVETHTVLRYDRLGVGLSDRRREPHHTSLESELGVLDALLDEHDVGSCSLVGVSCGGCFAAAYARRHPERVQRLVIYAGWADGQALAPPQAQASLIELVRGTWGFGSRILAEVFMTGADDRERSAYVEFQRTSASADMAADLLELIFALDIREDLAHLRTPTVVIHRTADRTVPFSQGREVATLAPDARLIPLPGDAHHPWRGDASGTGAAIASALDPRPGQGAHAAPLAQSLTAREREVLTLVARGFSDSAIAEQLVLSTHTVHRHVANIRNKLNLPSRTAAAAFAVRAGLE
jgi:pimeloyl-ACP methyl ester carboxylesterase/DNA-binding CsgD family transcriptional regulator